MRSCLLPHTASPGSLEGAARSSSLRRKERKRSLQRWLYERQVLNHMAAVHELFERLAGGAHLYLCGLKGMQPGIEAALEAAAVARGLDFKTWIKALRKEKRYHVEVY